MSSRDIFLHNELRKSQQMFIKSPYIYLHRLLMKDIHVYTRNLIYIFLKSAST